MKVITRLDRLFKGTFSREKWKKKVIRGIDLDLNKDSFHSFRVYHRRRINTEEKAKVVAAAWGTECRASYFAPG